jgi:hypothetical protein
MAIEQVKVGEMAAKATPRPPPRTFSTLLSVGIDRAFARFLEMPVVIVLTVLWFAGAALMGSCALALYSAVSALIQGWWLL